MSNLARRVTRYTASVLVASATAVHAAVTLADGATTLVTTAFTQPDVPRNLTVKGNQGGISGSAVITGTNAAGEVISETFALSGTNEIVGVKAFASVTSVLLPARNAGGDSVSVGVGSKLGLAHKLPHNTVLFAALGDVREGTAPTVATSASTVEGNTVTLNSALNGTAVDIYYVVP